MGKTENMNILKIAEGSVSLNSDFYQNIFTNGIDIYDYEMFKSIINFL